MGLEEAEPRRDVALCVSAGEAAPLPFAACLWLGMPGKQDWWVKLFSSHGDHAQAGWSRDVRSILSCIGSPGLLQLGFFVLTRPQPTISVMAGRWATPGSWGCIGSTFLSPICSHDSSLHASLLELNTYSKTLFGKIGRLEG